MQFSVRTEVWGFGFFLFKLHKTFFHMNYQKMHHDNVLKLLHLKGEEKCLKYHFNVHLQGETLWASYVLLLTAAAKVT